RHVDHRGRDARRSGCARDPAVYQRQPAGPRDPRDGHRAHGEGSQDVGPQRAQSMLGCPESVRHRRRLHGVDGVSESIDYLHGTHRACGGLRRGRDEKERAMTNVRGAWSVVRGTTDRRSFLQTFGGIVIGACMPNALRTTHDARRLDKVGLQLYTVRDQMKADFEGTLARVAEIGYKEVEFAGYFNHSPADVRAILDRHGLSAPSTHVGDISPDAWKASLDAAHAIGHEYIVVPWIPQEKRMTLDGWKQVAAEFNRAAQAAHDAGVQFAYHNHDFEFPKMEGQVPYDILLQTTDPKLVQLEI